MGMTLERAKLYYDQAKHMMTLSAVASAFAMTMYEKLSKAPVAKICIPISLLLFALSLVSFSWAMLGWASHNPEATEADEWTIKMFAGGLFTFCAAFTALMVFVLANSFLI